MSQMSLKYIIWEIEHKSNLCIILFFLVIAEKSPTRSTEISGSEYVTAGANIERERMRSKRWTSRLEPKEWRTTILSNRRFAHH